VVIIKVQITSCGLGPSEETCRAESNRCGRTLVVSAKTKCGFVFYCACVGKRFFTAETEKRGKDRNKVRNVSQRKWCWSNATPTPSVLIGFMIVPVTVRPQAVGKRTSTLKLKGMLLSGEVIFAP
jgi:hypothetical protein